MLAVKSVITWPAIITWEFFSNHPLHWKIIPVLYLFFWNIATSHYFTILRSEVLIRCKYLKKNISIVRSIKLDKSCKLYNETKPYEPNVDKKLNILAVDKFIAEMRHHVKGFATYTKELEHYCMQQDGMLFAWPIILGLSCLLYWIVTVIWVSMSAIDNANVFLPPLLVDALFIFFVIYLYYYTGAATGHYQNLGQLIFLTCNELVFYDPELDSTRESIDPKSQSAKKAEKKGEIEKKLGDYSYLEKLILYQGFKIVGFLINISAPIGSIPVAIAVLTTIAVRLIT